MRFRQKILRPELKVLEGNRVEAVLSDESKDRDGDIIRQAGWDLGSFKQHPVLLASHDYRSVRAQIGEWEDVEVDNTRLVGVARYYVGEGNPEADWAWKLAQKGRAAYSVGFVPKDWNELEKEEDEDGWPGYEFTKQELLEVSHVTVPSNSNALQLMARAKGLDPTVDAIVKELLEEETSSSTDPLHVALEALLAMHQDSCESKDGCSLKRHVQLAELSAGAGGTDGYLIHIQNALFPRGVDAVIDTISRGAEHDKKDDDQDDPEPVDIAAVLRDGFGAALAKGFANKEES